MLVQNDASYMDNVNFAKYLLTLSDLQPGVIFDIGYHGKTVAIDDQANDATLLSLKTECDSNIGVLGDILANDIYLKSWLPLAVHTEIPFATEHHYCQVLATYVARYDSQRLTVTDAYER
jgi:hypothetical protein